MNADESRLLCPDVKTGVMLFHGLTGMPSEMKHVAKYLTKLGCKVECPMLAGHGAGHKELLAVSWKDWIAGAKADLDKLSEQCDHVVVGGLSMGALVSLFLTLDNPKVSGAVLLSPTLKYDSKNSSAWNQVFLPLIDIMPILGHWFWWTEEPPYGLKDERLQKIITRSLEAAMSGESSDFGLFRTYSGSLRQLQLLVKQVRKIGDKVTVPSLIIHSLEDTLTTIKNATQMCDLMPNSEKELILMGGCDHVLTLDLRRNDVINNVGKFVIKASWDRATKVKPQQSSAVETSSSNR